MKNFKYIILGAGPAGLAFANGLLENKENSFVILEKNKEAGGLCRSEIVDDSPLDTGGGHFLDTKNEKALKFIFKFMPENEWKKFTRVSTIKLKNNEVDYPFESNIWQFPVDKQIKYLISIFKAGCNAGKKMPNDFIDWITWKLGDRVAKDYMIPYNEKIWSINLNKLGTYWLYKLPNVSMEESLLSCLERKPSGTLPAHANFFYPIKYGYNEVWKRMADKLGDRIKYDFTVKSINVKNRTINEKYSGEKIVVTIPWNTIDFLGSIPSAINKDITSLMYSSIRITYHPQNVNTRAHWTYIPDKEIPEHRYLYRFNFIKGARGYWTETNEKRSRMFIPNNRQFWINKFAYPLNTLDKPKSVNRIIKYFSKNSVFGLGRWGEWEHMNSDIAVVRGLELADKLVEVK